MSGLVTAVLVLGLAAVAAAQPDPPVVSNVIAQQRAGTMLVDITYDLALSYNDTVVMVEVYYSLDGGQNFDAMCSAVSGAVGTQVPTGTGLAIVWDAASDVPGVEIADCRVRVLAYDWMPPPILHHLRVAMDGTVTDTLARGVVDTIGYGRPFRLGWVAEAPAIEGYDPVLLAMADTVFPFDDGILGYKWQLPGELGGNCIPTLEDCWHPRYFNAVTGDSTSYYGTVDRLLFSNSIPGSENPFDQLLPSGVVTLQVDALDIFGSQVPEWLRDREVVVNRDPHTVVLDSTSHWDDPNGDGVQIYPYYVRLNDPTQTRVPFRSGARIPDRTYVVVKGLGRDDPDDLLLDPYYGVGMSGQVQGERYHLNRGRYFFQTEASVTNADLGLPDPAGWYADTLGFMVGPRTTYRFNMSAVDEHGRYDGTPDQIEFHVGYEPCLQCIELKAKSSDPSDFPDPELECYEGAGTSHPCLDGGRIQLQVTEYATGPSDLEFVRPAYFAMDKATFEVTVVDDTRGLEGTHYFTDARIYRMRVLLHAQDDSRERWSEARWRAMAWRYQVDYECDPDNQIKDGGGIDDISQITQGIGSGVGMDVGPDGLWSMEVEVAVPAVLLTLVPFNYWATLYFSFDQDTEAADAMYWASIRQLGDGFIQAVALDQTNCTSLPGGRPAAYNYFRNVRNEVESPPAGMNWRDCILDVVVPNLAPKLDLGPVAMESNTPPVDYDWWNDPDGNPWTNADGSPVRGEPAVRDYRIVLVGPAGEVDCHTPPQ